VAFRLDAQRQGARRGRLAGVNRWNRLLVAGNAILFPGGADFVEAGAGAGGQRPGSSCSKLVSIAALSCRTRSCSWSSWDRSLPALTGWTRIPRSSAPFLGLFGLTVSLVVLPQAFLVRDHGQQVCLDVTQVGAGLGQVQRHRQLLVVHPAPGFRSWCECPDNRPPQPPRPGLSVTRS